jgi:prevent-host-death family protein
MRTIDIHEAKAKLFELIERAARGQSFLIAISGTPRVMVLPLESREARHLRRVGLFERCLVVAEEGDTTRSLRDLKG